MTHPPQVRPLEFPADAEPDLDELYGAFTAWWAARGISLYPHQDEALIELAAGSNVIISTPTGSGKSLVASGALYFAAAQGQRAFYTAPIKALVSEKFFDLCAQFGADNVGMLTGDASVNPTAPIICATAEVVANIALREGEHAPIGVVVMDEFHYYAEPDRGWAWQVPLIELPGSQFVLMSATLGDVSFFVDDLQRRTGRDTAAITGTTRPVPLDYSYSTRPVHETIEELIHKDRAPVYVVHFTQLSAMERAQSLLSANICSRAERDAIAEEIGNFRFSTGFGKTLSKTVRAGIGVHHAGMLPRYRRLVERLAQQGLLRVVCGTDTLGVGINVPIRTVLLTGLTKYDGVRQRHLKAREFHQIAGRAGRAGFDVRGFVVAQAPDHDVENARLVAKAGDDPKKLKKIQRKKAPEGFVSWGEATFSKLIVAPPEPLRSRFAVTTSMLLEVIARPGNCFTAMRHLLEDNHETRTRQRWHILRALRLYRSLIDSGVVRRLDEPDEYGRYAVLAVDLPANFALNNPLSPFALATFELLDVESESYTVDLISIVEATLDDPRPVLMGQQKSARDEAIARMKADGVEYEERMELLTEVTWPRPLREFIFEAFGIYQQGHPWVADTPPRPKSVVRQMIEEGMDWGDLISRYSLARSEGVVLRYLTDVYRTLRQSIPNSARTDEVDDVVEWLGDLVRRVDSSLLDEWEQLTHPEYGPVDPIAAGSPTPGRAPNARAIRVHLRNTMFRYVNLLSRRAWFELQSAYPDLDWAEEMSDFLDEYGDVGAGPAARGPALFSVTREDDQWVVRQVLDDPDGHRGWSLLARFSAPDTADDEPELQDMEIIAG
ncbi:DEAD/DEAH box helicase [Williamsia soli]|uniref:DEAD/DEAH box helicase n=1 Tax=Williamsia soli TaxID=364929 RepID=UPI001A9D61CC|nr:DEAD/DEAH box helicase [Williamsia soli]